MYSINQVNWSSLSALGGEVFTIAYGDFSSTYGGGDCACTLSGSCTLSCTCTLSAALITRSLSFLRCQHHTNTATKTTNPITPTVDPIAILIVELEGLDE